MFSNKSVPGLVAGILVLVGAINWGLVGLGIFLGRELNVVTMLVGTWPSVEAIVYVLVGLSGLYLLATSLKD